jgi:3-oxoacyl-[acyl-carrier protein] reductase
MSATIGTPLVGKVALVTGASRSIGASIARDLANAGASVAVNYANDASSAQAVVAEVEAAGKGKVG